MQQQQNAYQPNHDSNVDLYLKTFLKIINKIKSKNFNTPKHKKAQKELSNEYRKRQLEYVQGKIEKNINSLGNWKSCIAWKTVMKFLEVRRQN